MKNLVLTIVLFLTSTIAFAEANLPEKEALEMKVLTALIAQSSQIELVEYDYESPDHYRTYAYTLPEILSGALKQNYLSGNNVLSYTHVDCEPVENSDAIGVAYYGCNVTIGSGDFEQSEDGLKGPIFESSLIFSIDVVVPIIPNAKPQITTTQAVVMITG